jgi:hypothetical protein
MLSREYMVAISLAKAVQLADAPPQGSHATLVTEKQR